MTWSEFKKEVEAAGVQDTDRINQIDTTGRFSIELTGIRVWLEEKPHLGGRYLSIADDSE